MPHLQSHSLAQISLATWDRKLADDLATELEGYTGEKRCTIEEMRRFLGIKAYRELLERLRSSRQGKTSRQTLKSVARAMRYYALERPALYTATFRTPATDCPEWREAYGQFGELMRGVFAECGLHDSAADQALHILRSLVRGYVLHEITDSFLHIHSHEESYEKAIDVFIAGLSALTASELATARCAGLGKRTAGRLRRLSLMLV
jgi:Tetracyclin repressor-like, C-terminal domain